MRFVPDADTFAGRNLRRVARVPLRVVRGHRPPVADPTLRLSSYPFVSGDGLAAGLDARTRFIDRDADDPPIGEWWFREVFPIESEEGRRALLEQGRAAAGPVTLVIHNGDLIPPPEFYAEALGVFREIWSVNVVDEADRLHALPIGLQNRWLYGAHDLVGYVDASRAWSDDPEALAGRSERFFASFRTETNPAVRSPIADRLVRRGIANESLPRDEYRRRLLRTKFVLSPPGNGTDCHRTWEALIAGAVPVVLRDSLAASLVEGTPILAVDDWDEVLDLSETELDDLFLAQAVRSRRTCLLDPWVDRILGEGD